MLWLVVLWMVGSLLRMGTKVALCSSPGSQQLTAVLLLLWAAFMPFPHPPPALPQVQPIFKQFPLTCNVTNKLYRGWDTKIVAFRVSAAGCSSI